MLLKMRLMGLISEIERPSVEWHSRTLPLSTTAVGVLRTLHRAGTDGGFDLFSIQERMSDLGGTLELVSQSGAGCSAVLRVPLNARNPEARP